MGYQPSPISANHFLVYRIVRSNLVEPLSYRGIYEAARSAWTDYFRCGGYRPLVAASSSASCLYSQYRGWFLPSCDQLYNLAGDSSCSRLDCGW